MIRTILTGLAFATVLVAANRVTAQDVATGPSERNQVVALSRDGLVTGRVVAIDAPSKLASPLSGIDVFFVRDGLIARSTVSDDKGNFSVDGLAPGSYSFIGASAKGFVAYGVVVQAVDNASSAESFMVAPTVAPRFIAVSEIAARYLPKRAPVLLEEIEMKTSLDGVEQIDDGANRVFLQSGNLVGNVRTLASDVAIDTTKVFLVQNDAIVAESTVDSSGGFVFQAVTTGVFDFVAAGPGGFAAIGFEAISEGEEQSVVEKQTSTVVGGDLAARADQPAKVPAKELRCLLTLPVDSQVVAEQLARANELAGESVADNSPAAPLDAYDDAIGCGAACGSTGCGCQSDYFDSGACCGGAGGGGGWFGGGFGGLAAAALFAWAITEFDDNDPNNPPPSSPSN